MSAEPPLAKLPSPALFALVGALAGLLSAFTAGESVWRALSPPPPVEQHTEPPKRSEPLPSPATPVPQLAITAAPVTVYPGGKNTFGVRVARDRFEGEVKVRFETPTVLSAAEITIPAGDTTGKAEVVAPADAKPGTFTLTATATATVEGQTLTATAGVQVTVAALPPPPARMAVSTSPRVQAYQKGKNTFAVRVARAAFDDEITITFDGLPTGVKIPAVIVPAGKSEATAELTADAAAKTGAVKVTVTARAAPKGVATVATAEVVADVRDPSRVPLDIVLALDCTGSMKKSVDGLCRSFPTFAAELRKARFDPRFGVVGFRDTTFAQPLELPKIGGERMSTDVNRFAAVVRGLRLGGGGGEGESSLDGIAEAADFPLHTAAPRVILLVTDGEPKRIDARMRSVDAAVKHLREKRIDQLHIATLLQYRKAFEPLWDGAKGKYFDLKAATDGGAFDKLVTDLSAAIAEAVPPQPEPKPEPSPTAPAAVLPEPAPTKLPDPPASSEPEEPRIAPPAPALPDSQPEVPDDQPDSATPDREPLVLGMWAAAVVLPACLMLLLGQLTVLPGTRPTFASGAAGYGGGLVLGLLAGALGYLAFDALGVPLAARLGSAGLFGLGVGLMVALAERAFSEDEPDFEAPDDSLEPLPAPLPPPPPAPLLPPPAPVRAPLLDLDLPTVEAYPTAPPKPKPPIAPLLDLDLPPVEPYPPTKPPPIPPSPPAAPVHKPNITGAPKPGDGCPKCGRKIPGAAGTRYCMLCDTTF